MPTLPLLLNIVSEVLVTAIKGNQIRKEEVKLSVIADDTTYRIP